jgi:hypothetical protein
MAQNAFLKFYKMAIKSFDWRTKWVGIINFEKILSFKNFRDDGYVGIFVIQN